jgi:hypothetical protein
LILAGLQVSNLGILFNYWRRSCKLRRVGSAQEKLCVLVLGDLGEIDVSFLPKGVYIAEYVLNKDIIRKKLVVY